MPSADPDFESNVFINCPFDADYEPLKKALLYTVVALGYHPRISTERAGGGEYRHHAADLPGHSADASEPQLLRGEWGESVSPGAD